MKEWHINLINIDKVIGKLNKASVCQVVGKGHTKSIPPMKASVLALLQAVDSATEHRLVSG